jgi:hypothetical protein
MIAAVYLPYRSRQAENAYAQLASAKDFAGQ